MKIAMLGSGFIGRFYADSIQGQRSRDKIVSIYSRREESAKKFAEDYGVAHVTTNMEESIAHPDVEMVCISLPNHKHEEAVMLCCKHKKAVICTKPLGRNAAEALRMLNAVEKAGIFHGYLEDLVYTPKSSKAIESVRNGALGRILWAKSRETHPDRTATGSGTWNRRVVALSSTWDAIALRSHVATSERIFFQWKSCAGPTLR